MTALVAATIWLVGCATTSNCPPVAEYPAEFRTKLADEIQRLPEDAALVRAMEDYYVLRKQVKACAQETVPWRLSIVPRGPLPPS
jgi:hypothetical protein